MDLPKPLAADVAPLFAARPQDQAMSGLVVTTPPAADIVAVVESIVGGDAVPTGSALESALWLYVDDLDRSHTCSQSIDDTTGSYWHGIMHRREGDFSNSHYWFRKVGNHPAMALIDGYDPHRFIDEAEAQHGDNSAVLVDLQHREWNALFAWTAMEYRGQ